MPSHLGHNDPEVQKHGILRRSFVIIGFGTCLALLFADPAVSVMQDLARRRNISAFYISFALALLASNASEVVAAYKYASRKTRKNVNVSFTTLIGAAILNNTFVLGVFMLLIVVKGLAWKLTAETIVILLVEFAPFYFTQKKLRTLRDGLIVLSLHPISIFLVTSLESIDLDRVMYNWFLYQLAWGIGRLHFIICNLNFVMKKTKLWHCTVRAVVL